MPRIATIFLVTLVAGCSYVPMGPMVNPPANTPQIGFEVFENGKDTVKSFGPTGPADPGLIFADNVIVVEPGTGEGSALKTLEITVGNRVHATGDCTQATNCQYLGAGLTSYRIDLDRLPIDHADPITIAVTTSGGQPAQVWLEARQNYTFTGVISPVLMRATGKASGFRLSNLAPSLAGGMQRNFNSDSFKHLGLNALVTVYTLPESEYALSVGGVLDLGGWAQLGATYHTREEEWNMVIGTRPEFLFGLFPALRPKD